MGDTLEKTNHFAIYEVIFQDGMKCYCTKLLKYQETKDFDRNTFLKIN